MALLLGYGMAVVLTALVYTSLRTRLLLRPIRRCLDLPACFHCDYSLEGVPMTEGRLACPERGALYPSAEAPEPR